MTEQFRAMVIAGGTVIDGSGGAAKDVDIVVRDGRIDELRPHGDDHSGFDVVDAEGLVIAPGFIDTHSHGDNAPFVTANDTMKILQGITTEVVGNCGFSLAPISNRFRSEHRDMHSAWEFDFEGSTFAEFLSETDRRGYLTNYAPLVGHGTLRLAAMGMDDREPSGSERAAMAQMLEEALDAGAFGMSTGLIYPPGVFSRTDEIIDLARQLRPGSVYASHIRGEASTVVDAVKEAIAIGEESGRRVVISHHKAMGKDNWGATKRTLEIIHAARERGVDVFQDVYPYTAGSTYLSALIPPEFHGGGKEALLSRLKRPEDLERIAKRLGEKTPDFQNIVLEAGYESILISSTASGAFEGMTLVDVARDRGTSEFEALVHVLITEDLSAQMVVFFADEDDVKRVMRDERTCFGTDGASPGTTGKPHPRTFGTFPRVLGRYVREEHVLTLEAAVQKMTSLPAEIFGLSQVGAIAPGKLADLVAFDAGRVSDDLDYQDPVRSPKGIAWVMMGGQKVVEGDRSIAPRRGQRFRPCNY